MFSFFTALKQDFSEIDGAWHSAAELSTIICSACLGYIPENKIEFKKQFLPDVVESLLAIAGKIQPLVLKTDDVSLIFACTSFKPHHRGLSSRMFYCTPPSKILHQGMCFLSISYCEKSVGTTELHYSTKKRYHVLTILKSFFSSDTRQSMKRRIATER